MTKSELLNNVFFENAKGDLPIIYITSDDDVVKVGGIIPAPKGLEANASYIDMSNTQQPAAEPAPAANANAGTGASRACPLP